MKWTAYFKEQYLPVLSILAAGLTASHFSGNKMKFVVRISFCLVKFNVFLVGLQRFKSICQTLVKYDLFLLYCSIDPITVQYSWVADCPEADELSVHKKVLFDLRAGAAAVWQACIAVVQSTRWGCRCRQVQCIRWRCRWKKRLRSISLTGQADRIPW